MGPLPRKENTPTMFSTSPNEIEASDIDAVQRTGDATPLGDGRVALPVLLILSSESGKTFTGEDFPIAIHLTNGVQARRVDIEDARPVLTLAPGLGSESAPESAPESTAESQDDPATEPPLADAAAASDSAPSDAAPAEMATEATAAASDAAPAEATTPSDSPADPAEE